MNKIKAVVSGIVLSAMLSLGSGSKAVAQEQESVFKGVVFFKNPFTGGIAMYFAFELQPNREYSYQITTDGVKWTEIAHVSTKGLTHEIYESFNVSDPCNGVWPRVLDLGPSK